LNFNAAGCRSQHWMFTMQVADKIIDERLKGENVDSVCKAEALEALETAVGSDTEPEPEASMEPEISMGKDSCLSSSSSSDSTESDNSLSESGVSDKESDKRFQPSSPSSSSSSDSSSDSDYDVDLEPHANAAEKHLSAHQSAEQGEQQSGKSGGVGLPPIFAFLPSSWPILPIDEEDEFPAATDRSSLLSKFPSSPERAEALRRKSTAALQVQTAWRGRRCTRQFEVIGNATLKLQRYSRVFAARKLLRDLRRARAALRLQRWFRRQLAARRAEPAVRVKVEARSRLLRICNMVEDIKSRMDSIDPSSIDLKNEDVCDAIRQMEEMSSRLCKDASVVDLRARSPLARTPRRPTFKPFKDTKSLQSRAARSHTLVPASTTWGPRSETRRSRSHEGDFCSDEEDPLLGRSPCSYSPNCLPQCTPEEYPCLRAAPTKDGRRSNQAASSERSWISSFMSCICEEEGGGCVPVRTPLQDDLVVLKRAYESVCQETSVEIN